MKRIPLNTDGECAKTILSGYYKYGVATLIGGNFGTTGTIILEYGNNLYVEKSMLAIQRVGDRDKVCWSIKDIAFTINANPMSDRMQFVLEFYADRESIETEKGLYQPTGGKSI